MQDLVANDRAVDMVMGGLPALKQAAEATPAEPKQPEEKPEKAVDENGGKEGVTLADEALDAPGGQITEEQASTGRLAGFVQLRGSPALAFGSRTQALPEMALNLATSKPALVAGVLSVCVFGGAFMLWQFSRSRHPR